MRYLTLCCDYDGTLATEGCVQPETFAALERLIRSGRRVVLVTGRELDELKTVCPRLDLFEYVVAENGALLYQPSSGTETLIAEAPPASFVQALRARGVERISVGRAIVATWEPHEMTVLETIKDQGLDLQVIFNKGAVMVLPAGVNKATGLSAALEKMCLSPHNAVGIGDAENDHALLGLCECGVAVANALPTLKERADFVTRGSRGEGVVELIAELLQDDLASRDERLKRHHILLGSDATGAAVCIAPYGHNVLLVGDHAPEPSSLTIGLLERLSACHYTYCLLDTRGDYQALASAVALGTAARPPALEEVLKLFWKPGQSAVVQLQSLAAPDRWPFAEALLEQLSQQHTRTGRPHWVVIDGIDQLGAAAVSGGRELTVPYEASLLQVIRGSELGAQAPGGADVLIATARASEPTLRKMYEHCGLRAPPGSDAKTGTDEAVLCRPRSSSAAVRFRIAGADGRRTVPTPAGLNRSAGAVNSRL